jgi:hypothetical protein
MSGIKKHLHCSVKRGFHCYFDARDSTKKPVMSRDFGKIIEKNKCIAIEADKCLR